MPKPGLRTKYKYSEVFKATAVQLGHLEGVQVKEVAETLDIHPFMLSRWRKEYREGKIMTGKRKKVTRRPPGMRPPHSTLLLCFNPIPPDSTSDTTTS